MKKIILISIVITYVLAIHVALFSSIAAIEEPEKGKYAVLKSDKTFNGFTNINKRIDYKRSNEVIFDSINYTQKKFDPVYDPVVCVVEDEDDHLKNVLSVLRYFFLGDVYVLSTTDFYYNISSYSFCDVFNLSFSTKVEMSYWDLNRFDKFFKNWDGTMVLTAGNDETKTVKEEQKLYKLKEKYPEQVIIVSEGKVSQLFYEEINIMHADVAYGDYIDIVVPTRGLFVNGYELSGTSFAAPVITGSIAIMHQIDGKMDPGDVQDVIFETSKFAKGRRRPLSYPVFDFSSIIRNVWSKSDRNFR